QTQLTCPDPGLGDVTIGRLTLGALASPGFYSLASLVAVQGGPPVFLTLDFSTVRFDAATLGLSGHVYSSFLGGGGGTHADDLALTDIGKTWILADDHVTGGFTEVSNGTYTVARVPEASSSALFLLGSGVVLLEALRRKTRGIATTKRALGS